MNFQTVAFRWKLAFQGSKEGFEPCSNLASLGGGSLKDLEISIFDDRQDSCSCSKGLFSLVPQQFPSGSTGQWLFRAPPGHWNVSVKTILLSCQHMEGCGQGETVKLTEWCSIKWYSCVNSDSIFTAAISIALIIGIRVAFPECTTSMHYSAELVQYHNELW